MNQYSICIASPSAEERALFQKALQPLGYTLFEINNDSSWADILEHQPELVFYRPFGSVDSFIEKANQLRQQWSGSLGVILSCVQEADKVLESMVPCDILIDPTPSNIQLKARVLLKRLQSIKYAFDGFSGDFQVYASLFERAGVGVAQINARTGYFVRVNQKFKDMVGYADRDFQNLKVQDVSFPEDLKQDKKYLDALSYGNMKEVTLERRLRQQNGEVFWGHVTVSPMWKEGESPGDYVVIVKNIGRRKMVEKELEESQRRLQQMFKHHHAVMLLIEPDTGLIIDANKAATEFYGYSYEVLTQMSILDINQLDNEQISRELEAAKDEHRNYFVFPHRCSGGEIRMVEVHSTPFEMNGKGYLFSIIHDITQKHQAQKILKQRELQYRQLFEFAPIGIGVATQQGELLAFNQAMMRPGGYTQQDILDLKYVQNLYYRSEQRQAILNEYQSQGRVARREVQFKDVHQNPYDALLTLVPIEFDGQPCILALAEDISEQKRAENALIESEARYRLIVETAEEGILLVDQKNKTTFMNQKMSQMLGFEHPDEALGLPLFDFVDQTEYETLFFQTGDQPFQQRKDFRLLTKDKKPLWVNMSMSFIYAPDNDYLGMLAMVTDITHLKANEERIRKALDERNILLKEVHHRVKNNFQVIISLLNLQMRKLKGSDSYEPLAVSKQRIQSMSLVHEKMYQTQELGRINFADYLRLLTQELYMTELNATEEIHLQFDLAAIDLELEQAIPAALIVNELIANAYKYAFPVSKQEAFIQVLLQEVEGTIYIEVQDNGCGFKENGSQSLGLQLVSSLVQQLDGDYRKIEGPGTHWVVSFPSSMG